MRKDAIRSELRPQRSSTREQQQEEVISRAAARPYWQRAALWLSLALTACTPPNFRDPDEELSEQELDPVSAAEALVGTYVARTDSFSEDSFQINRAREIALVEITQRGSQLELRARTCAWSAQNPFGGTQLADPSSFPLRQQRIAIDHGHWRTLPSPITVGYDPLPPDACEGHEGQLVQKQPGQDWLLETCRCPPSADVFPGLDDCRITDADGDGAPGTTYNVTAVILRSKVHFVRELLFHYVKGTISPTGHHTAREALTEQSRQLSCDQKDCLVLGQMSVTCPAELNRVQLAPLLARDAEEEAWTCDEALEVAAEVLAYAPTASPAQCRP
jgi:hypothetical protein